jgi:hypothetical protein
MKELLPSKKERRNLNKLEMKKGIGNTFYIWMDVGTPP